MRVGNFGPKTRMHIIEGWRWKLQKLIILLFTVEKGPIVSHILTPHFEAKILRVASLSSFFLESARIYTLWPVIYSSTQK